MLKSEYDKVKNTNITELGEISNIYQPQTISSSQCNDGDYYVFGANGIIGKYSKYNHEKKQITISCRGENSGTINITPEKCWINGNSMVINIDNSKEIKKEYLKYILESQNLKYLISGSGQPQIIRSSVTKHKIPLIDFSDQDNFSRKFQLLENITELEITKLAKFQELKKGLMQNMFV